MLRVIEGDIALTRREAVVCSVSIRDHLSGEVAFSLKSKFPDLEGLYMSVVKYSPTVFGLVQTIVLPRETGMNPGCVICIPTRVSRGSRPDYELIAEGIDDLYGAIRYLEIRSVSIPALGCGKNGLEWHEIRDSLSKRLQGLAGGTDIDLYSPYQQNS